jgi:hypothetical protein
MPLFQQRPARDLIEYFLQIIILPPRLGHVVRCVRLACSADHIANQPLYAARGRGRPTYLN